MLLATGLGLGFSPIAPGTVGALAGLPLAWAIAQLPAIALQLATIVGLALIGIPLCTHAVRRLGRKDPGCVVWDEIASLPITFFLVPVELWSRPGTVLIGFSLSRVFDILKPPPARQLERLPEGLGVMADDWAAGVYSCLAFHALLTWGPSWLRGG
jgi:phosphatidylglycerophosphatase A